MPENVNILQGEEDEGRQDITGQPILAGEDNAIESNTGDGGCHTNEEVDAPSVLDALGQLPAIPVEKLPEEEDGIDTSDGIQVSDPLYASVVVTENSLDIEPDELENLPADMSVSTDGLEVKRNDGDLLAAVNYLANDSRNISALLEEQSEQTLQLLEWTRDVKITGALSKLFLLFSLLAMSAVIAGQGYSFYNMIHTQRRQDAIEAKLTKTMGDLQKRDAEHETAFIYIMGEEVRKEREKVHQSSTAERLNKLRNGRSELKILRKESGDWFIPGRRSEELITDPGVIETLNHVWKQGRPPVALQHAMPPFISICLLSPDGKGGTRITLPDKNAQ